MAIRPVLHMGNPFLLQPATEVVDFKTEQLQVLIDDMFDTMRAEEGAGLAAPQVGVGLRIVVFGFEKNERYPDAPTVPRTVLINPVIKVLNDELIEDWEGCLSVPGMRGMVPRYSSIEYSGFNESGEPVTVKANDFHARVVQHECDHLDGILYPQRIRDLSLFGFTETLLAEGQL